MAKDVVIYQGEYKTAIAEIENQISFLIRKLNASKSLLADIQLEGVQDELIRGKIGNITSLIDVYIAELEDILADFLIHTRAGVTEIKLKDRFDCSIFAKNALYEVESVIAALS